MVKETKKNDESPVRIMEVDDHDIVRRGLSVLISRRDKFEVVGEAATAQEAVTQAQALSPDVVVMDIRLPDGSGIEACRDIRAANPDIKVLMLTSYSDDEAVIGAIMAGASGYLLKEIRSQGILDAVGHISQGKSLLDPAVTAKILDQMRWGNVGDEYWNRLTDHEKRILELITEGQTNKEISKKINLSDKTVKNYVSNILRKLEVERRSQAAAFLARRQAKGEFSS